MIAVDARPDDGPRPGRLGSPGARWGLARAPERSGRGLPGMVLSPGVAGQLRAA
jgi:hypothetical protein